jgi:hypothetical protein
MGDRLMAAASRTVRVKFDGDTTGLAVAARNGERIVDRFADKASRQVTSRFRTWFTGQGANESNTVGRFFARTFGTGLLSGFSVPTFGPLFLAAMLAVVVTVAPVIGAALAAGIVLAFGAGIAGLGLVFAAQSQQVKDAFSGLKESLVTDLKAIAKPFEATLVQIAGLMKRTFDSFRPILAAAFADLAPIITTFADQFFRALDQFKPAITAISDAFGDLLDKLGPRLPALFADIADTISNIAATISENDVVFAKLITFFVDAVDKGIEFVGWLADVYVHMKQLFHSINLALDPFSMFGAQTADAGVKMGAFSAATEAAMAATDGYGGSLRSATQALSDYAAAQLAAVDPVFALINAATTADEAQTSYNEAVRQFGVNSPQAAAAAVAAAEAVSRLEQAALAGDISFGAFDAKLRQWVGAGKITAAQAEAIRVKVRGARGEAEDFQGTYEATVAVRDRATAALRGIRAWLAGIQSKTVTITARSQIPQGVSIRQLMEGRQHGGPVAAGRSYLVGERGMEVFTPNVSGKITPNHELGGGGGDARGLARAVGEAINGATLVIDDRGRGRLIARTADLYGRTG